MRRGTPFDTVSRIVLAPTFQTCPPPTCAAAPVERVREASEALDARFGPLPFAERLKIENERAQRAKTEPERHASEGPRAADPSGRARPARAADAPAPLPAPSHRPEPAPAPVRARLIVQTLHARPGDLLDVFA